MSKTRKRLWIISMLLIYVAIAIGGFVVAYEIKHNFLPQILPPTVSSVMPAKTPTGWETYTNQDDKLQFAYPPIDHVTTASYGFGVSSISLQEKDGSTDFQVLLFPKTLAQAVGQNFDDYYSMSDNTTKVIKSPMSQDNTTEKFTKIRNRSINGLEALDYQSVASSAPKDAQPEIGTFIVAGNNLVLFSTGLDNKIDLEKMLSSLSYSP